MNEDHSDTLGKGLLLGMAIGAAIFAMLNGVASSALDTKFWLGSAGALSVLGPIFALAAGLIAYSGYKLSRSVARASRFQKGAEMLGNSSDAVIVGGMYALADVVREDAQYRIPTMKALTMMINDSDAVTKARYQPFYSPPQGSPAAIGPSSPASAEAICVFSRLRLPDGTWPKGQDTQDGRAQISNAVIIDKSFSGEDFRFLEFNRAILHACTFNNCDFSGSLVHAVILSHVRFIDCKFDECILTLNDHDGSIATVPFPESKLFVTASSSKNAVVNEGPFSRWVSVLTEG